MTPVIWDAAARSIMLPGKSFEPFRESSWSKWLSNLSGQIAKAKVDEALETGAQAIVTACQQCVRTMATYVRRNKLSLDVMDIVQLVQKALAADE